MRCFHLHAPRIRLFVGSIFFALLLMLYITCWSIEHVQHITAPGNPPHAILRASRYGYDVGLDTLPARLQHDGRIQLWFYGANDPELTVLIRILGYPALSSP